MMKTLMQKETVDPAWKPLYRVGGYAPWVMIGLILIQILVMFSGEPYPVSIEDWFSLFQRRLVLGLLYINVLDIFTISLLGVVLLALCVALRKGNESATAIAAFLAVLGTAVFVTPRADILAASLSLTREYAAAMDSVKPEILNAGRGVFAMGLPTLQTTGFLFIAAAVVILSALMLRSGAFGKAAAITGVLAGILAITDYFLAVFAPAPANALLMIGILAWTAWWILIGLKLLRLGGIGA
ncbi:MAG: hypothetical protein JW748_01705 [Anaerolineales bacterium]|nr:hypothetical protein [Anaerolineales bacterium]